MAWRKRCTRSLLGTVFSFAVVEVSAAEFRAGGWPIPEISTSRFLKERRADIISEIPGPETIQRAYSTPEGTYFNTLEYKGYLYGYYVDVDGRAPMDYTLLDLTGDGRFEHKSSKEDWVTPAYLLAAHAKER